MIANLSRLSQFQECRQKAWNWHELGFKAKREAEALLVGDAFHVGAAHIFSSGNVEEAVALAESTYRKRLEGHMILPEERVFVEQQIELAKRSVAAYGVHYASEDFRVLMPEVQFCIPMPNTLHHCWFFHKALHPNVPFETCPHWSSIDKVASGCYQPHMFRGRTDGVILWNKLVWLLEHKTTSMTGDIFYDRFYLDVQPTGYLYGIWKSTNLRPHGFVLNVIKKPNKRAANQYMVGFEREAYLRSEADLDRFEREFIMQAEDYERAWMMKQIYMNTKSCTNYNRRCYYWEDCKRNSITASDYAKRDPDYVDLEYYKILGIPSPYTEQEIQNAESDSVVERRA